MNEEKRNRIRVGPPTKRLYAAIYILLSMLTILCCLAMTEAVSEWSIITLLEAHNQPAPLKAEAAPSSSSSHQLRSIIEQIKVIADRKEDKAY